jgi:hypothetical protein
MRRVSMIEWGSWGMGERSMGDGLQISHPGIFHREDW